MIFSALYLESIAEEQNKEWLKYSENELKRSQLLGEIITHIGFGGFIHNYKNAILRKETKKLEKSVLQITHVRQLIRQYRELYPSDDKLILEIDTVLMQYYNKAILMRSLINSGLDAEGIDAQVKVDDFPALESFAALINSNASLYSKIASSSTDKVESFKLSLYSIFFLLSLLMLVSISYIVYMVNKNIIQYKRMKILFDLAPLSILAVDEKGGVFSANKIAIETFGLDEENIDKVNIDSLTPDHVSPHHHKYREEFQTSERIAPMHKRGGKFSARRLNGDVFPANISIATYSQFGMKEAIVIVKDISDEVKQLRDANHDALTQLPNRRSIDEFLSVAVLRAKRQNTELYIAIIDIDFFKKINDKFGHSFGDSVLVDVAKYLQKNIRETDFIGRWGGEEFLLILENSTSEGALKVCETIRKYIANKSRVKGCQYTVSIGCAKFVKESDIQTLFDNADVALYLSKNSGRNKTTIV